MPSNGRQSGFIANKKPECTMIQGQYLQCFNDFQVSQYHGVYPEPDPSFRSGCNPSFLFFWRSRIKSLICMHVRLPHMPFNVVTLLLKAPMMRWVNCSHEVVFCSFILASIRLIWLQAHHAACKSIRETLDDIAPAPLDVFLNVIKMGATFQLRRKSSTSELSHRWFWKKPGAHHETKSF